MLTSFRSSILTVASVAVHAVGQTSDRLPRFEVVSIHTSAPGQRSEPGQEITDDGVRFTNLPVLWGILRAYGPTKGGDFAFYTNDLVIGGPDWMRAERYDVDARISDADRAEWMKPPARKAMLPLVLQAMLADRFHLAVHREHPEKATFALLVGKGGAKLAPADPAAKHPTAMPLPGGAFLDAGRRFEFYNAPMATLAIVLSNLSGRPVEDATGLTGRYDFAFDRPQGSGVPSPDAALAADAGPTVFTIVQEQLGLKLEPRKSSVETLVIDHLDRPSPN